MKIMKRRKKPCLFCKNNVKYINYKDIAALEKFIHQNGTILARRVTGTCASDQRMVSKSIKRAREVALLAYVNDQ